MSATRALMASAVLVLAGGAFAPGALSQTPPSSGSFFAVAAADGVRSSIAMRGYLLVERVADLGAPTAQAAVTEVEGSAYAGYPWPGEDTLSVLLLGGGKVGADVPFPLAVQASTASNPESELDAGAVVLRAKSTEETSSASAAGGVASDVVTTGHTTSMASASRDPESGEAVAESRSVADSIRITNIINIGSVRSHARVAAKSTGDPERKSGIEIAGVTIGAQRVVIGPEGISLLGSKTALPRDHPLLKVLAEAGVTVEYVQAVEVDDGVIAAGLRVTVVRKLPDFPEPLEARIELGRARAFAGGGGPSAVEKPSAFEMDSSDTVGTASRGIDQPASGGSNAVLAVGIDNPTVPAALIDQGHGELVPTRPAPASLGRSRGHLAGFIGEAAMTVDAAPLYGAIAAAGLILLFVGLLTRLFAVRLLWEALPDR